MGRWQRLHEQANAQRFITRGEVRTLELPDRSFEQHARNLGWSPSHRGLWVPPGLEHDHRKAAEVAGIVIGGELRLTGGTALYLGGITEHPPADVCVVVDIARSPAPRHGICVHTTSTFAAIRFHHAQGLALAATARAIADRACHVSTNALCREIAAALRLRRCTMAQLDAELGRRMRFPGRKAMREAISLLKGETVHSASERLARRLLRAGGHRPLGRPLSVEIGGRIVAEIDVPFPQILYGVEVDGPHHLLAGVASADRQRDRKLVRAGWTIDRFWWDEIEMKQRWFVQEVGLQIQRLSSQQAR